MRRSARSQAVGDLPIEARGGLLHRSARAKQAHLHRPGRARFSLFLKRDMRARTETSALLYSSELAIWGKSSPSADSLATDEVSLRFVGLPKGSDWRLQAAASRAGYAAAQKDSHTLTAASCAAGLS